MGRANPVKYKSCTKLWCECLYRCDVHAGEDLTQARSPQEGDDDRASEVDRTPTFILQPAEFYYVTRAKPTTITCRAVDAVQINFKCVEQWVPPTQHDTTDGVETQSTRRRYIQVGPFIPSEHSLTLQKDVNNYRLCLESANLHQRV